MKKVLKVLIMAGGTGGHVFPALAVAKQFLKEGAEVLWLGTRAGFEADIVPKNNIPIRYITVTGLRGKSIWTLLLAPFRLFLALYQSICILRDFKPDVVLGMGGFVAGPGGLAAWLLRIPLVIHEQNAVAGTTNRILSQFAKRVLEAFPNTFPKQVHPHSIGNPVREELLSVMPPEERFQNRNRNQSQSQNQNGQEPLRLLIIGGSQGARALNELCPKAFQTLNPAERPTIWHQTGKKDIQTTQDQYQQAGVEARVVPFIVDMVDAYTWADLVLCRAGALTVSELAVVGLPSILVPFPFAIDNHQMVNGQFLANHKAAILISQSDLTPPKLADIVLELSRDRTRLLNMAGAARKLATLDAVTQVIVSCKEVSCGPKKN